MSKMKCLLLSGVLLVGSALPAAAQNLGLGASFLGDEGGVGFIVDYSRPFREVGDGLTLSGVGDVSFHHKGFDSVFGDYSAKTLFVQGGVRVSGAINEKLTWHGQGQIGIARFSLSDDFGCGGTRGIDCSDTDVIFTPGGGITYQLNEKSGVRGQLDFPISGGSTERFSIMYVLKLGNP